ncbi:T9SS type B sorting domain-containing protein [Runella salmonicolor]|uniref:Gliding motility-associated C-terminal domain-containing protein n=1 Tax=Runella salmonicolor TaxID=2950278 RepID=A0ABT1FSW0_9BACT|nr:gliding motility-associated C-terminal domain-containing protein [Runella salmonicolor]MCP1383833.1 gliding motility-associated C-terminal domain-containing protein [Runella salmonicolor]
MKRALILISLLVFIKARVLGQQVDCGNIGFESGTTLGWELTNGVVRISNAKLAYQNETTGSINARHYITSISDGFDPKITNEKIPMVAPGSTHSIRIGTNYSMGGGSFDRIKTSFLVTPENTLFQYQFALVLQNDNRHVDAQKSGFDINITDSNGEPLSCNSFGVQLQNAGTSEGFKTQGDIEYKNWTTGAIDLRNYIGRIIKIEVTAHGCTGREHFGYAYFDAQCVKSEVKVNTLCPDAQGYMTLNAPDGFGSYLWSNGEKTANARVKANLGEVYTVKISPLDKLDESCQLQLDYKIKYYQADTSISRTICEGEEVKVDGESFKTTGIHVKRILRTNVCDSTVRLNLTVIPAANHTQTVTICLGQSLRVGDSVYTKPGTYLTAVARTSGCDSMVTTRLIVEEMQVQIIGNSSITQGDSTRLEVQVEPAGAFSVQWSPSLGLACASCPSTWVHPLKSTQYTVAVKNASQACQQSEKVNVFVLPCNIYIPDIFSPNNDQQNDVFYVYGNSCVKQIKEMAIYNRWGEIVFRNENFTFADPKQGWDGRYLGEIAEGGVYVYKIAVAFTNGETSHYTGSVLLVR